MSEPQTPKPKDEKTPPVKIAGTGAITLPKVTWGTRR